ncbi:hypothetical protein ACFL1P_00035 [Patescibacteria group bacterium]
MSDEEKQGGKFTLGFFFGGLLGAIIIFFLGTKEGKQAGKKFEKKGRVLLDELSKALEELETKEKEIVTKSEEIKVQVEENIQEAKQEATKETTKELDTALTHIEELQERGRKTTANLRKRIFKNLPKKK